MSGSPAAIRKYLWLKVFMVVVLMGMSWFMVFEVNETYGYPLATNRMLNYRNKVLSLDNKNPKKKHVIKEITPADVINVTSYLKKTNAYSEFYKNRRSLEPVVSYVVRTCFEKEVAQVSLQRSFQEAPGEIDLHKMIKSPEVFGALNNDILEKINAVEMESDLHQRIEVILDSGADDAQGKAIKTEGRRMLNLTFFDDNGSFCRIQEAFTVASVINPLMAIGKLFREGWELRVNEEEGMCLTDGSSRIPVHLHKNSLAAYAYVQTPSRSRGYSSNNYKMVRTVVQLNKHVQEAVNKEEPGWHNTDSMVIVKYEERKWLQPFQQSQFHFGSLALLMLLEIEQTKKAMVVTTGRWFRVKPEVVEDLKAEAAAEELKKKKEEHYQEKEDSAAPPEAEESKDEEMREAQEDQEAPQEVVEVLEESFHHEGVEYTAQRSSLKELQALCREYGVKTTGSKKQLLKRLATAVREERLSAQHKEQREHHQAYHLAPPQEPTEEERAYHNLTHLPYQPWCPHCVAMKAREDNHKKGLSKPSSSTDSAKPVISFDFCYTSTTGSEEPPAVTLVAVDSWSKAVLAVPCKRKGGAGSTTHLAEALVQFTTQLGYNALVLKADNENAAKALKDKVQKEEREQLENDEAASDPPSSEEPSSPSKLRKQVNRAEETDGYLNMPHDDEVYEADDEFVYESEEEEEETESEPTEASTKVPVEFFDEEKGPPNVDPDFLQKLDDEATVKEIKRLTKMGVISLVSTDPQEATENVPLVDSEQELHKWLTTKLVKDWRFREATGFEVDEATAGTTKPKQIQRITKLVPMLALANNWAIYSVDVKGAFLQVNATHPVFGQTFVMVFWWKRSLSVVQQFQHFTVFYDKAAYVQHVPFAAAHEVASSKEVPSSPGSMSLLEVLVTLAMVCMAAYFVVNEMRKPQKHKKSKKEVNYDVDSFDEAKKEVTERTEKLKKVEESLEKEKEEFENRKTEFEETVKRFLKKQKEALSEKETALEEAEENVKAKEAEVEKKKKEAEKRERKAQERTVGYDQEREEYAKKYVDDAKKDLERELKVLKQEEKVRNQKLDDLQYDYKSLKEEVDALLLAAKDKIVKYKKKVKSLKETIGAALSGSEGEEETEEAYKTKAEEEKEKAEAKAKEEEKKKGKKPKQVETEDPEEKPSSNQGDENTFDPNDIAEFTQLGYVWEFNKKTQEYRAKCEDKKGAPRIKNAPVKGRLLWNKVTECYRRHNVWFTDGKELDKFLETKENEKIEEENDGWWYNDQWNNENWNTTDDGSNWYENTNPQNKGYWQTPEEWAQQNQWEQWTPKGKSKVKKSKNWVQTQ
ncbi:GIP [Symbiodinium sp. CCMP2592]|nr:GIP [Symbiodinium sp. CCMP2592]